MVMDAHQLNVVMIPHDIADPKIRHRIGYDDKGYEKSVYNAAFKDAFSCEMPPQKKATLADATHQQKSNTGQNAQQNVTSNIAEKNSKEDYTEIFRQQQAAKQEASQKKIDLEKKEEEKRQAEIKENNTRQRARYLQDQLDYWKSAAAKETHDEQTIMANIDTLERELNTIDSRFWVR